MYQDKTIAVTGSAGFIGSHLCQALLARGARVVGIDNLDPFYDRRLKLHNIEQINASDNDDRFTQHELDICDADALSALLSDHATHAVIHLAAKAGVRPSIEDPVGYAHANVTGTQSVLSAASGAGCQRVVAASSSSVYGNNKKTPFSEADPVERPISPYAATKLSCELIAQTHTHLTGMPVAMLRFFTVFGPRQRPDLAINLFLSRISRGETISKFGDGSTSRDYTYIADIIHGVLAAYERIDQHGFRVWNLGGDHPATLNQLIDTISKVVDREPAVNQMDMQPGDVDRTWADLSRSRAELDYAPTTSLREGIERQWQWMKQHRAALETA